MLQAVLDAERKVEGPVYFVDVIRQLESQRSYLLPRIDNFTVLTIIYDLYRADEINADAHLSQFCSFRASPKFHTYSERISKLLGEGFRLDHNLRCIAWKSENKLSLKLLKRLLVSTKINTKVLEKYQRMAFDGELRFLDESDIDGDRTVFTSYPKSGASMLRQYL